MIENSKNIVPNDNSKKNKKTVKKDSSWLKDENHSVLKKLKENNIFARKYFYPLMTELSVYKKFSSNTPNAKKLSEQVLCLPMYPTLANEEIQQIINVIKEGLK